MLFAQFEAQILMVAQIPYAGGRKLAGNSRFQHRRQIIDFSAHIDNQPIDRKLQNKNKY